MIDTISETTPTDTRDAASRSSRRLAQRRAWATELDEVLARIAGPIATLEAEASAARAAIATATTMDGRVAAEAAARAAEQRHHQAEAAARQTARFLSERLMATADQDLLGRGLDLVHDHARRLASWARGYGQDADLVARIEHREREARATVLGLAYGPLDRAGITDAIDAVLDRLDAIPGIPAHLKGWLRMADHPDADS